MSDEQSPFDPHFNYAECYPIPEITEEEFESFHSAMVSLYGEDRGNSLAQLTLWTTVGLPQRLAVIGYDDTSSMVFARNLLDIMCITVTGLTVDQMCRPFEHLEGCPNGYSVLLSDEMLGKLCYGHELISTRIEAMFHTTYDGMQLWNMITELENMARAIGHGLHDSLTYSPFISASVYDTLKSTYTDITENDDE